MQCNWCFDEEVHPDDWHHKSGECKNDWAHMPDEGGVICADCADGIDGLWVNVEDAYPDGFTCTECCAVVMPNNNREENQ